MWAQGVGAPGAVEAVAQGVEDRGGAEARMGTLGFVKRKGIETLPSGTVVEGGLLPALDLRVQSALPFVKIGPRFRSEGPQDARTAGL